MTEPDLVRAMFDREGRTYSEPPRTDQPTGAGGITLGTLRDYVAATRAPLAVSVDTLRSLTVDTATPIVTWKLRTLAARSGFDLIDFEPLRLQLIDFAFNSGVALATRWLQRVLGVPRTGVMDAVTVATLKYPNDAKRIPLWIHQAVIAARLQMVDSAVDGHAIAKPFEDGLERRVERFSLLEVP